LISPSGGSVGVPASLNSCGRSGHSWKAMSEVGHQQPTVGNSLPPNNPPLSSASLPHTPAATLRRGHRNLQLLRPQVRCEGYPQDNVKPHWRIRDVPFIEEDTNVQ
jgi:hypothetical protein